LYANRSNGPQKLTLTSISTFKANCLMRLHCSVQPANGLNYFSAEVAK